MNECGTYIYNGALLSIKQNGILTFETTRIAPWEHYAERNKSDKVRQILYEITKMWNLEKTKQTPELTDTEDRLVAAGVGAAICETC